MRLWIPDSNGHFPRMEMGDGAVIDGGFRSDGRLHALSTGEQTGGAAQKGAAAIFRLPVISVLSGYDTKAFATLSLCDRMGNVEALQVPVRCAERALLEETAMLLFKEPMTYQKEVRASLAEGLTIREARAAAADRFVPGAEKLLLDEEDSYAVELRLAALRRYSTVKLQLFPLKGEKAHPEDVGAGSGGAEATFGSRKPAALGNSIGTEARRDRRMAEELIHCFGSYTPAELLRTARMTPSCPWQISERLETDYELLQGEGSFSEMAAHLATGHISSEQVRRGLLMLLLGIRLPNLSIAGLEAFCPYVRLEGGDGRVLEYMKQRGIRGISGQLEQVSGDPLDESRMHLAGFDVAADTLYEHCTNRNQ